MSIDAAPVSALSTHVLDTSLGRPARGIVVRLEDAAAADPGAEALGVETTDADGRVATIGPVRLKAGDYRLTFDTAAYFAASGRTGFYPEVAITFTVTDPEEHYHVPLLLNPFGYSTYRGS